MAAIDPIRTERLVLRELRAGDWTALDRYSRERAFWRHLPGGPPSPAQARLRIDRALAQQERERRTRYDLAVEWAGSNRLCGTVHLTLNSPEHAEGELGFGFAPAVWGRGIATEAAAGLRDYGMRQLGLHRIWATCDPDNAASQRVLEKLSMAYEGELRGRARGSTGWRSQLLYAVLAEDLG